MVQGSNPRKGKIFVSSPKHPDRLRGPFLEVKQLGPEIDRLPSSGADIKNEWTYTSAPHMRVQGMDYDNCLTSECNVCGCDTVVIGSAAASFSVLAR